MNTSDAILQGFKNYYDALTNLGYVPPKQVNSLIVASWINDVLEGKYDFLVDESMYNILNSLYMCVEGSCLVPYKSYCRDVTVNKNPVNTYVRMTDSETTQRILDGVEDLRMV